VLPPISLADVRALVFDAVGTLINPDPPAAVVYFQTGQRFGSRVPQELIEERFRRTFAEEEQLDRERGWQTSESREIERWKHIVAGVLDDIRDPEGCFRELFQYFAQAESWRCLPQAGPVLEALAKRGFSLGMASNYDSRLRTVVQGKAELRSIGHLIISSEIGWRKPSEKFFAAIGRTVAQPVDKILYIGDDPINDYQGAAAAGLRAVLFDPNEEEASSTSQRVSRLEELLAL
jgi:putative hydrolase of the HAD superfamily